MYMYVDIARPKSTYMYLVFYVMTSHLQVLMTGGFLFRFDSICSIVMKTLMSHDVQWRFWQPTCEPCMRLPQIDARKYLISPDINKQTACRPELHHAVDASKQPVNRNDNFRGTSKTKSIWDVTCDKDKNHLQTWAASLVLKIWPAMITSRLWWQFFT